MPIDVKVIVVKIWMEGEFLKQLNKKGMPLNKLMNIVHRCQIYGGENLNPWGVP